MLLERLGLPYETLAPQVEETVLEGELPAARALRLARAKAAAVALHHPGAIVIGSDQVASLGTPGDARLLRKPGDRDTCRAQLIAMSGQTVSFDTAVALQQGDIVLAYTEPTHVQFRDLTAAAIEHYMDREPAFDCAGGFKCEGLGVTLFQSIGTRDPTALVGLPLIWVCEALRRLGVPV
jgi:septum formation protein